MHAFSFVYIGSRSIREGINWLVFGFCRDPTVIDLVDRTGVERLMDGRLLRAAGLMSKSAMAGLLRLQVADVVMKPQSESRGGSAQRHANMHS